MSLTPTTPDLKDKKFWFQKDSIGAWVIVALVAAVAFWGWGVISAFVVMALTNTLQTIWLVAACVVSIAILTSKRFHILLRLISRWLTNLFIPIFPLEILADRIDQQKKRNAQVQAMISKLSGKIRLLKDTIAKNYAEASHSFQSAAYAKSKIPTMDDKAEALRYGLQVQVKSQHGARLEKANMTYQDILGRIQRVYDFLVKAEMYLDAFIADASDELDQERIKHDTISDAYQAFKSALGILKGDVTEEDLYGRARQFLNDDYSQKSGEIEDGMRVAQVFIDNMDIENGTISDSALQQIDQYEQKLLTAGSAEYVPAATSRQADPVGVPRQTEQQSNYKNLFK